MVNETKKVERFDYSLLKDEIRKSGYGSMETQNDEWVTHITLHSEGKILQNEYAPAKDFYMIQKNYYANGNLHTCCKYLGNVSFGIRSEYDDKGNLIRTIDEDAKFGKLKPQDITEFIERIGWINRERGESVIFTNPRFTSFATGKTDGSFYQSVQNGLTILFGPAEYSADGKEISPPVWSISYYTGNNTNPEYIIDGNTGEYTLHEHIYDMIE